MLIKAKWIGLTVLTFLVLLLVYSTAFAEDDHNHWAYCYDPTECAQCGQREVTISKVYHTEVTEEIYYDQTSHWQKCLTCGENVYEQKHFAQCEEPTVCRYCGQSEVAIDWISHFFDYDDYKYDKTSHWVECMTCGEKVNEQKHFAACNAPTICLNCKQNDVIIEQVKHNLVRDDVKHDQASHWWICTRCGERVNVSEHFDKDSDGKCDECGVILKPQSIVSDINDDGVINLKDSMLLLQYLAGWNVEIDRSNADINGDGSINLKDSMLLLQYLAGWESAYIK